MALIVQDMWAEAVVMIVAAIAVATKIVPTDPHTTLRTWIRTPLPDSRMIAQSEDTMVIELVVPRVSIQMVLDMSL